jgi:hypothetical protein
MGLSICNGSLAAVIGFVAFPAKPDFAREFHLNRLANAMKLKSDAAAKKPKDQLSRDFVGCSIFNFCNNIQGGADIVQDHDQVHK